MNALGQGLGLGLLLAAAALGAVWLSRQAAAGRQKARRAPQAVAVQPRPMLGRGELPIWHWLRQVFPEHAIMVKLPLTRFSMPRDPAAANDLFAMLGGLYCTFTLCDNRGRAAGCVDVIGARKLSRGNRQLKQTLLSQCRVGYWVLTADTLPEPWAIRAEFLGHGADGTQPPATTEPDELRTARDNLVETLDRKRSDRRSQMAPLEAGDGASRITDWGQPDSFPVPLDDSRTTLR